MTIGHPCDRYFCGLPRVVRNSMTKTLLTAAVLASLVALSLNAQQTVHPCGANDLGKLAEFHHNDPVELARMEADEAGLEAFTAQWAATHAAGERVDYVIPVVFHIIHNHGSENISDAQVLDAIRVLNDDFNKLNSDWTAVREEFIGLVANVGITFRLATKDPQGNCSKGITRTASSLTNDGTQAMKNLIQWPRNKYLNVWVAASADGAAGYTYRPGSVNNWSAADGIVLLHNYTGSIGTSAPSRSRTLTHEVGHWINLSHAWGGTNDPGLPENCDTDDNVSDTPNTIGWTSCNVNGTSCGSLDNVQNYMEYSYCSRMFTEGQKVRMIAALNSGTAQRNQLIAPANLIATGATGEAALCAAEFTSNVSMVCAGNEVVFIDQSFHTVTSRTWSFPGGVPETSTDQSPTVVYPEPGSYSVALTVSDGNTSLSTTLTQAVTVLADTGFVGPVVEGFETLGGVNGPEWYANDLDAGNTFGITSAAAFTGTKSLRLLNGSANAGQVDEFLSQTYDMSHAEAITMNFRYAYARRNSTNDDILNVYVSNDCGGIWVLRKILRASNTLTTGGTVTGSFVPNNASQWGYSEVTNISTASHVPNLRFKFEFISNGGNNLYIDDINIDGGDLTTGISGEVHRMSGALVVPNPATDQARLFFTLPAAGKVELDVIDALGRTAWTSERGPLPAGDHTVDLVIGTWAHGTYTVRIITDKEARTVRFVKD